MANMKSIGSEKLPLEQKLKRIMEIANYGVGGVTTKDHKSASLTYSITGADGNNYGIIRESSKYNILKEGENGYQYLDGMLNNKKYTFNSYSQALKKLNLLMKPLNESYADGRQLNLIGEQEEDTKFVLKTPEGEDEEEVEDFSMDLGGDEEEEEVDLGGDEEEEVDFGGDEEDLEMDVELGAEEEEENFTKSIQKLTGKLGQKLRDVPETELDSDLIKYVLNSIISAVDIEKLSEDDVEDIIEKLEGEETEYTEEGEFDVELSGEEELDLGGEEETLDFGGEEESEEIDLEEELSEVVDLDKEEELGEWWQKPAQAALAYAGTKLVDKALGEEESVGDTLTDETAERLADIFSEGKTHQTISKYFKYTPKEKQQKSLQEQKRQRLLKKRKDTLLNETLKEVSTNRKIKNSISTYEQEFTLKKFLKENKNSKFVGNNKRGSLIFKNGNNVVEITKYGTKV